MGRREKKAGVEGGKKKKRRFRRKVARWKRENVGLQIAKTNKINSKS